MYNNGNLQTEEEREWFASAFESRNDAEISNQRKTALANLMLKCQVCHHRSGHKYM